MHAPCFSHSGRMRGIRPGSWAAMTAAFAVYSSIRLRFQMTAINFSFAYDGIKACATAWEPLCTNECIPLVVSAVSSHWSFALPGPDSPHNGLEVQSAPGQRRASQASIHQQTLAQDMLEAAT